MQVKKANVETIYPLSFLQQALLFHSLQKKVDQGFLQVKCLLKGKINLEAFQDAWRQNIQRHESLRTSVHWENLDKPVQVVHREVSLPFTFQDWSENSEQEQKIRLQTLLKSDAEEALNLNKAPVLRIFLVKLSADKHFLLWDCHHILADGWSGSIILKDLLAFYEANCSGKNEPALPAIPSYKSYLNWLKRQDSTKAKNFWIENLNGFGESTLVGNHKQSQRNLEDNFQTESLKFSEAESQKLRSFCQKNQITLNTLIQGIWAILLSRYVEQDDIVFGTVVSGRSTDLPNAELMAGMFMNVLPLRIRVDKNETFSPWLKSLQLQQAKTRDFEYFNLDDILYSSSSSAKASLMFDTLVVFENIPLENMSGGGISFESFESGLTTTYTLTLAVIPNKEIEANLKYHASMVSEQQIGWLLENLKNLIENIIESGSKSLGELINSVTPLEIKDISNRVKDLDQNDPDDYQAPKDDVELKLLSIWEGLLNLQPISVTDDFFDIGGTSIIAIRLFAKIENQFNRRLQPIILLKNRTIRALAELIKDETKDEPWSALVPLRASGSKPPVFCMHAGGGHVFYLKDLAKHLGADQPVYALQKLGLNEKDPVMYDVKTMASHYLSEIRKVQPKGPYSVIGYCLSAPVCYEIALQLNKIGEECAFVGIIDSRIVPNYFRPDTFKQKIERTAKKIRNNDWSFVTAILRRRLIDPIRRKLDYLRSSPQAKKEADLFEMANNILLKYVWEPYPGKITLIATEQRQEAQYLPVMVADWKPLAKGGLDVFVVPGDHGFVFYEPGVKGLAAQIKQCLDKANK
ncbi:hypothetical protein HRG84_07490 [Flavisolibacter sp. BT320]|nr:hypothetical protein [Flavisolibacter longurius]